MKLPNNCIFNKTRVFVQFVGQIRVTRHGLSTRLYIKNEKGTHVISKI